MPNRHGHHQVYCPNQSDYTEEYAKRRLLCIIAPCYFINDLPKSVYAVNDKIVQILSRKHGAPPMKEIKLYAENLRNEMLIKYID